jgi:hypothetical protein
MTRTVAETLSLSFVRAFTTIPATSTVASVGAGDGRNVGSVDEIGKIRKGSAHINQRI